MGRAGERIELHHGEIWLARRSVKVYDPTVGTTPVETYTDAGSVPLTMSDHALVLEVQ
jgi:hypothetical protein